MLQISSVKGIEIYDSGPKGPEFETHLGQLFFPPRKLSKTRARPSPLSCENEYLVLALGEEPAERPDYGVDYWEHPLNKTKLVLVILSLVFDILSTEGNTGRFRKLLFPLYLIVQ